MMPFPSWRTWAVLLGLALSSACPTGELSRNRAVTAPRPEPAVPVLTADAWRIASNADMGPWSDPQAQPVDFSIWQAADGT